MADKRFNIKDLLDPIEVTLNIPHSLSEKGQFDGILEITCLFAMRVRQLLNACS